MLHEFNVLIEKGEDGYFISEVVELPGRHTQAKTLDELMKRTKETISRFQGDKAGRQPRVPAAQKRR